MPAKTAPTSVVDNDETGLDTTPTVAEVSTKTVSTPISMTESDLAQAYAEALDLRTLAGRLQTQNSIKAIIPMTGGKLPATLGRLVVNDTMYAAQYQAMADVLGDDFVLFQFVRKPEAQVITGYGPVIQTAQVDDKEVPVLTSNIGQRFTKCSFVGYWYNQTPTALLQFGNSYVIVSVDPNRKGYGDELRSDSIRSKYDDARPRVGVPPLKVESRDGVRGVMIDALEKAVVQGLHPKDSNLVPWNVPLTIQSVSKEVSRYEGQLMTVTDGQTVYENVIATGTIRQLLGYPVNGSLLFQLDPVKSVGRRFVITGAEVNTKNGEPADIYGVTAAVWKAKKRDGEFKPAWTVIVSNPDDVVSFD